MSIKWAGWSKNYYDWVSCEHENRVVLILCCPKHRKLMFVRCVMLMCISFCSTSRGIFISRLETMVIEIHRLIDEISARWYHIYSRHSERTHSALHLHSPHLTKKHCIFCMGCTSSKKCLLKILCRPWRSFFITLVTLASPYKHGCGP